MLTYMGGDLVIDRPVTFQVLLPDQTVRNVHITKSDDHQIWCRHKISLIDAFTDSQVAKCSVGFRLLVHSRVQAVVYNNN